MMLQPHLQHRFWFALLLVSLFALAGCAPRVGGGEAAASPNAADFSVDLPAVVIEYNAAGEPTIANLSAAQLEALAGPGALAGLMLSAETLASLTSNNIQHIQLSTTPSGVKLMVNGLEIPTITWDADSLAETTNTLSALGMGLPDALKGLLPLTSQLGIGAIVKFPLAAGQAALPLTADSTGATDAQAAADSFLAQVGVPAKINIPVVYEATGDWSVAGMTSDQWSSVVAAVPWGSLKLTAEQIGTLSKAGVAQMDITTDSAGIHIAVNGKALPFVNWGDGKLNNVIKLAGQAGALSSLPVPADQLDGLVEQLLPMLTTTNVSLHVTFPK